MGNNKVQVKKSTADYKLTNKLEEGEIAVIDSRFGKIKVNLNKKINFEFGLLGMADKHSYCLANFPDPKYSRFKILQCIDDTSLAFIVLPIQSNIEDETNNIIDQKDIQESCLNCGFNINELAILLITCIYNNSENNTKDITVNTRAPLIIDLERQLGVQYVFHNSKYVVRQSIDLHFDHDSEQ